MGSLFIPSIAVVVLLCVVTPSESLLIDTMKTCWETWSRCSTWSAGATGYLWLSCEDLCMHKGYATGYCRLLKSDCPVSDMAWRCHCSNTVTSSPKPVTAANP